MGIFRYRIHCSPDPMKHPQGKRREYIDAAEAIAKAMLMSEEI
jgi:hypothetical protein